MRICYLEILGFEDFGFLQRSSLHLSVAFLLTKKTRNQRVRNQISKLLPLSLLLVASLSVRPDFKKFFFQLSKVRRIIIVIIVNFEPLCPDPSLPSHPWPQFNLRRAAKARIDRMCVPKARRKDLEAPEYVKREWKEYGNKNLMADILQRVNWDKDSEFFSWSNCILISKEIFRTLSSH